MKRNIKLLCVFLLYFIQILTGKINVSAQTFQVDTILYNGNPNKFINLVFMGDGYQSSQLSTYGTDVLNLSNYLFTISPFAEYKKYFNVFAIRVPSTDSETDHPGTATDVVEPVIPVISVNTYFNSTFDYFSIHRLLVPQNSSAINTVLINNFPLYDQKLMIVNSTEYGGSGGSTATSSLNSSAYEILVHEIGHSFANLADEYYAGDSYAAEKANMTQQTDPALVKWKNWVGYGGVGIYQHCCGGNSALWYRPHNGCKMRYLGAGSPFCPVCKEAIVEKIHTLFGTPIIFSQPNQTTVSYCTQPLQFLVSLVKPIPNTLRVKWKLNGNDIAMNIDSITITSGQLNIGSNALSVQVLDTTSLTRDSLHTINHIYTVNWTINYNPLSPPTIAANAATTFCQGNSVTLTASAATSYLWSNSATTQSITVSTSGNYSVTVTDGNGCSATSTPTTVTVNPLPTANITPSGATTFCQGGNVTLTASAATSYLWSNSATTQSITVSTTGNYSVTVTDGNGCSATSTPTTVTVNPLPTIDAGSTITIIQGNSTVIGGIPTATGNTPFTYSWTPTTGLDSSNVANPTASPQDTTTYTVVVTDANGCSSIDSILVIVNLPTIITELANRSGLLVFPNPANDLLNVTGTKIENGEYSFELKNVFGQTMFTDKLKVSNHSVQKQFSISELSNGMYFLIIENGQSRTVTKVQKMN